MSHFGVSVWNMVRFGGVHGLKGSVTNAFFEVLEGFINCNHFFLKCFVVKLGVGETLGTGEIDEHKFTWLHGSVTQVLNFDTAN